MARGAARSFVTPILLTAMGLTAALALSGCTVVAKGVMGIQRDSGGEFTAVVQMCPGGHVDGVSIFQAGEQSSETVSEVDFDSRVTTTGVADLELRDWGVAPDISLSSYAWSDDNKSSARGPEFTLADLQQLDEGEVLAVDYSDRGERATFTLFGFRRMTLSSFCDER